MKLLFLVLFLNQLIAKNDASFFQKDYNFIFERMSIKYINNNYIGFTKVKNYHYTRYEKRYNVTFCLNQTIYGEGLEDHLQGYKFQSNEYREFPFVFKENACTSYKNNIFGTKEILNKYTHNFTVSENCIIKKGCYYVNNIYFDDSKYPPYAPRGRYMLDYQLDYNKTINLVRSMFYIEIKPRNPLERVIGG